MKFLLDNTETIHYSRSNYIHFNWGWTEAYMTNSNPQNCNGWYYNDLFHPGLDTDLNNLIFYGDNLIGLPYNMHRRMIINITPN